MGLWRDTQIINGCGDFNEWLRSSATQGILGTEKWPLSKVMMQWGAIVSYENRSRTAPTTTVNFQKLQED